MNSKIAIMQPYLFPYIGYLNLINSCDKFVFYDDVNFIKKGWINKNYILYNNEPYKFTIPLKKISQNKKINETLIFKESKFFENFKKTLFYSYFKAPYFKRTIKYVDTILDSKHLYISELAEYSIREFFNLIGIKKKFYTSSKELSLANQLKGEERIIRITKEMNCNVYINSINGSHLYKPENFKKNNIKLKFISPKITQYRQSSKEFKPNLSIIDVLMYNSTPSIKEMIDSYIIE